LLREASSPGDAVVHNSYASALAATGRLAEAVAEYRKATALSPDYPDAHNNLASALVQSGRFDEAIGEFRMALRLAPGFAEAHSGLGGALAQKGRVNLCLALSLAGRPQEAIPHAERRSRCRRGATP